MTDIFEITLFAPIGRIIIGRKKQFRNFCWVKDNNLIVVNERKTAISKITLNERNSVITANYTITDKIFNLSFPNLLVTHNIPRGISRLSSSKDIKFTFHDGELFEVSIAGYVLEKTDTKQKITEKNDKRYVLVDQELIEIATKKPVKKLVQLLNHKPTFLVEFGLRSDFLTHTKKVMEDKIYCRLLLEGDTLKFVRRQVAQTLTPQSNQLLPTWHADRRLSEKFMAEGGIASVSVGNCDVKIPTPKLPILSSKCFYDYDFTNVQSPSVCLVSNFTIVLIEARFPYTQHFIPTNFYDLNTVVIEYKTFSDKERDTIKASYPESAKIVETDFSELTPQGWHELFY